MVTRLTLVREQNEKIFGRDPTKPYDGILIIQADVKTDFRIIRRIVASANGAGWAKMKFVTQPAAKPTAEGAAH
jgi:biopolymer transport protein ExbD